MQIKFTKKISLFSLWRELIISTHFLYEFHSLQYESNGCLDLEVCYEF